MDQSSRGSKGRLKDDGSALNHSKKVSSTLSNDEKPVHVVKDLDLPFLVTHWLANYKEEKNTNKLSHDGNTKEGEAILRIRNAAKELASAFTDLGAYGSIVQSPHEKRNINSCALRSATYGDMKRKWNQVPPNQLESTVFSSAAVTAVSHQHAIQRQQSTPTSILDAAYEESIHSKNRGSNSNNSFEVSKINTLVPHSMLHPPVLFSTNLDALTANGAAKAVALKNDEDRNRFTVGDASSIIAHGDIGPAGVTIPPERQIVMTLGSDQIRVGALAAQACRRSLVLKLKLAEERSAIQSLKRSLRIQNKMKDDITRERMELFGGSAVAVAGANSNAPPDELLAKEQNTDRVIAQLGRKMFECTTNHSRTENDFKLSKSVANAMYAEFLNINKSYTDPFRANARSSLPIRYLSHGNHSKSMLAHTIGRQYCGVAKFNNMRRPHGSIPTFTDMSLLRKPILRKRLKYSVTINCHLFYPVYCLRFDRTGRYFVSGADDQLVKLFQLGCAPSALSRKHTGKLTHSSGANVPGAVLVCTMRGHAAVITDIDVSADNSLLATASEDGDVRLWGLKDGAPIAILRGHTGGANMVSWSVLSPFRLVTTGHDGFAKMWDIRKAALKRYGYMVGSRSDFKLPKLHSEDRMQVSNKHDILDEEKSESTFENQETIFINNDISLPPIPLASERQSNHNTSSSINRDSRNSLNSRNSPLVRPQPPGTQQDVANNNVAVVGANGNQAGNAPLVAGSFVANDNIDEGVTLLMKLQHGNIVHGEDSNGPGTRARRKTVKVICLSRCPIGGHFATGSDDGLGRIWADDDDDRIEELDNHWRKIEGSKFDGLAMTNLTKVASLRRRRGECRYRKQTTMKNGIAVPSKSTLLATLHGHLSSITDIVYSNAGDRILTASQKDGIVRIWSWGVETFVNKDGSMKLDDFKQILIRLTKPSHLNSTEKTGHSRRRRGSSLVNKGELGQLSMGVKCDVASWTSDDSKIVTSQTCQVKATSTEIIPGSHVLHVWDSRTGQCLAGIHSSHSGACPVLVSHPLDSSILASAGSDGLVNVWDLDSGRCMFSHRNILQHGPVEPPTDTGKSCAYLDGNFGPDGLHLVLTDDRGRVTIIDILQFEEEVKDSRSICVGDRSHSTPSALEVSSPAWMKEQYFANDYYDLCYDVNGYCIEKGSEKPPHLAPRSARCNHTASSYSSDMNESLFNVKGPTPLAEEDVRFARDNIRVRSVHIRRSGGILEENVRGKRAVINAESITVGNHRFGIISKSYDEETSNDYNHIISSQGTIVNSIQSNGPTEENTIDQVQERPLSSRFRWSDYDDVLREEQYNGEDEKFDSNDEEYRANNYTMDISSSEEDIEFYSNELIASPRRSRNNGQPFTRRRRRRERQVRREQANQQHQSSEEQTRRVSSRSSASVRSPQYDKENDEENDGENDEEIVQYVSTNKKSPSGPYAKDYTVLGHFYVMPKGGPLHRKWVCRTERSPNKIYLPQVGDNVVYIPRAHFQTIQQFPTGNNESAPWKAWPTSTSWPVVRCEVKSIRFRFPFESYYRSRNDEVIVSIVAILTLEITGIPSSGDRKFPWPEPKFNARMSRSSNLTFEVSLFESNLAEFILPEYLYTWRISKLENTLNTNKIEDSKFSAYFINEESDGGEDKSLISYPCAAKYSEHEKTDVLESDEAHMKLSGYAAFQIGWESNEGDLDTEMMCSWELVPEDSEGCTPQPQQLSEHEKNQLVYILDEIECDPEVQSFFSNPVNPNEYSDYLDFIEVPMDLSRIRERLKNSYYTNTKSVLADMKLIKENCIKYNGNSSPVSKVANTMCDEFQNLFDECMSNTPGKYSRKRSQREKKGSRVSSRTEGHSVLQSLESIQDVSTMSNLRQIKTQNSVNDLSSASTTSHSDQQIQEEKTSIATKPTEAIAYTNQESDSEPDDFQGKNSETLFEVRRRKSSRIQSAIIAKSEEEKVKSADNNLRRRSSRIRLSVIVDHSNEEEYETPSSVDSDSENSFSSSFDEKKPVVRKTRLKVSRKKILPKRSSPRKKIPQQVKDDSSNQYDSESSESSTDSKVIRNKRRRSDNFDNDSTDISNESESLESEYSEYVPTHTTEKKSRKKFKSSKNSKLKSNEQYLPDIPIWPNRIVNADSLEDFCRQIMRKVEAQDVKKLFLKPVHEQYPQMADEYLSFVKHPMDFHTIKHTRIQAYKTIKCLQDDLILTLRNCCNFNGEDHCFWQYSVEIWKNLTQIFKDVCNERNIELPRRW